MRPWSGPLIAVNTSSCAAAAGAAAVQGAIKILQEAFGEPPVPGSRLHDETSMLMWQLGSRSAQPEVLYCKAEPCSLTSLSKAMSACLGYVWHVKN